MRQGGVMLNQEFEISIQQNPNLTVREFASQTGLKIRTFYRHWIEQYSPKEIFEEKKLEIAKKRLLTDFNKKIYEVARELHFCDHYYFSKWFRKKMGVSPQQYRMLTLKERNSLERKRNNKNGKNRKNHI